ncbi:TetR/AcrR family transcriptional regulator [Terriglobus roseus]|uniref:Transcriptional regulator, TetR family n=1 Tax=Terriglobus roseus TaxID=392734 RepID=A0A1G7FSJ6_9BACT|nr:TetR family transcriptional regulator [Terriglobus roseus]SDE78876.1 transcriptional regulator, TetR family [Terriglobus roseus]
MNTEPRSYSSPLRQQQMEDTRQRIVEAALTLISEQPQEAFSHEEIARRAGIALRTVYRHFPSRPELLDAVWKTSDSQLELSHYPDTEADMLAAVEPVYARMDAHAPLMRGLLRSNAGQEMRRRDNERRRAAMERALAPATAHLDAAGKRGVLGIFQSIFSGRAWETMRDRAHLQEGEPARATEWAMRTLLAQLYRDQKVSAREGQRHAKPAAKRAAKNKA